MKAQSKTIGFLNLHCGGTGALAVRPYFELRKADGCQVPAFSALIDTDPPDPALLAAGVVDACLPLGLEPDQLSVLKDTPQSFGPTVERIVAKVAPLLNEEDCRNGARTTRCLAELNFLYHRYSIASRLNEWMRALKHRWGCDGIMPILTGSSGGGTGSALIILLAAALQEPRFRGQVLQGFHPGLLLSPFAFVCEPFYRSYAHAHDPIHTAKILGNSFAVRVESAYLERLGAFKTIFHLGLANAGGAVLDSEADVARTLGSTLFWFQKLWETFIKPRTVDTSDSHALFGHYLGEDLPERAIRDPQSFHPGTAPSGNGQAAKAT